MPDVRLFFGRSFARERLNGLGYPDRNGISDEELGQRVAQEIADRSRNRIKVVTTQDPLGGYIDENVERDIRGCDYALFLFTSRVHDGLTKKWISSTYVISEAGAAKIAFGRRHGTSRIFGMVEESVDGTQLGLAFPLNRTVGKFRRDDLPALLGEVDRIVDQILQPSPIPRAPRQCLLLSKTATIWRSGAVRVECRYRFRFKMMQKDVCIPHTVWRVRERFPAEIGLSCLPIFPERLHAEKYHDVICDQTRTERGNEIKFEVKFDEIKIDPEEDLEYLLSWHYPDAFRDASELDGFQNSVGVCTSGRGPADLARLILRFERNSPMAHRNIESAPDVSVNGAFWLPSAENQRRFFRAGEGWHHVGHMESIDDICSGEFEAFRWECNDFEGMAKAEWNPVLNYLTPPEEHCANENDAADQSQDGIDGEASLDA